MNTTQSKRLNRLRTTERIIAPVGIVLSIAVAVLLYLEWSSFWLSLFGFIMTSRFVIGCVPKILFHPRKIYRTAFYLLWPGGGTLILYLVYQAWEIMWLAVLLGIIGGVFVSVFVGWLFFRDVALEDQKREEKVGEFLSEEQQGRFPEAMAMKRRFSSSEWEDIKQFPWMIFGMMVLSSGEVKNAQLNFWADAMSKPEQFEDPLLQMMLIDNNTSWMRSLGKMTSLSQYSAAMMDSATVREMERLAGAGKLEVGMESPFNMRPENMHTVKQSLNPDEFRSFVRGLVQFGLRVATIGGQPDAEQLNLLFKIIPAESKEDLMAMLGVEGS